MLKAICRWRASIDELEHVFFSGMRRSQRIRYRDFQRLKAICRWRTSIDELEDILSGGRASGFDTGISEAEIHMPMEVSYR